MRTRDEATTRVARGAAHLDTVRPGWFTRIDVGTLTLHDPCGCIVGQLSGFRYDFTGGSNALGLNDSERVAALGFDLKRDEYEGDPKEFQPLQDAWIAAIADRVLAAAQALEAARATNAVDPHADVLERVATRA